MKEKFLQYINDCYLAKDNRYPNAIFYVYDNQIIRQKKLNRILNKNDKININVNRGEIYFRVSFSDGDLYLWVSHKISKSFEKEYNMDTYILMGQLKYFLTDYEPLKNIKYVAGTNEFIVEPYDMSNLVILNDLRDIEQIYAR